MGMLQGGLSGLALSHSDVGGYTATPGTTRTKELLMRWMELSALSDAIFRTHQGNRPAHNAQPWDDDETLAHLAAFAKLHVILAPYKLELMRESERRGLPMARPLAMHYARDPVARRRTQQFLLGRNLLVAPVMDRGTNRVHAYLPPGDVWVDVWTTQQTPRTPGGRGEAFVEGVERDLGDCGDPDPGGDRRGTWVTVDAPLGWPAVFIRRGASGEARKAAAAMREWAAARGGVPSGRKVALMDPVEKLVLGLY
jgi:alpha-glucosidase (family GH31 glycosyl hydrolase)